jgi:hypothetical protein
MNKHNLVAVRSSFAGCMTTLNFLETFKELGKASRVALVEDGKSPERYGACRWTMAYLRLEAGICYNGQHLFVSCRVRWVLNHPRTPSYNVCGIMKEARAASDSTHRNLQFTPF